jgi:hypothetical protein
VIVLGGEEQESAGAQDVLHEEGGDGAFLETFGDFLGPLGIQEEGKEVLRGGVVVLVRVLFPVGSDRKSLFVGGRWEAGRSGESA